MEHEIRQTLSLENLNQILAEQGIPALTEADLHKPLPAKEVTLKQWKRRKTKSKMQKKSRKINRKNRKK